MIGNQGGRNTDGASTGEAGVSGCGRTRDPAASCRAAAVVLVWDDVSVSRAIEALPTLSLRECADRLGVSPGRVRRLVEEHQLVGWKTAGELRIPEIALKGTEPLPGLRGTVILLLDAGLTEAEAHDWLAETDETLGATPFAALQQGRKTQVRHSVQLLGM